MSQVRQCEWVVTSIRTAGLNTSIKTQLASAAWSDRCTRRLHPYDYFVDALQRVGQHPASLVHQLTPRIWKDIFAADRLRSGLHDLDGRLAYAAS